MQPKTNLQEKNDQAEPFYSVQSIFLQNLPSELWTRIASDLEIAGLSYESVVGERKIGLEQILLAHPHPGPELTQSAIQPVLQPDSSTSPIKRILVVDDEKYITFMLKEGLEDIPNCEIVTASTGEQALQLCQAQPFDMLISDYRMTGIDGLTLAAQVRQVQPQTVIIMLTAHSSDSLLMQAANMSIRQVLNKPIKLPEIRRLVAEVLNGAGNTATRTNHSLA